FWATSHKRRVPPASPVASILPSGANAKPETTALLPLSLSSATFCQVATSQSRTVLPKLAASSAPSGLNCGLLMLIETPSSSFTLCLLARSHTLTLQLLAARSLPSGEKAAESTHRPCWNRSANFCAGTSQSQTPGSSPPLARVRPSGANATNHMGCL